jgi:hypothetical protein
MIRGREFVGQPNARIADFSRNANGQTKANLSFELARFVKAVFEPSLGDPNFADPLPAGRCR